MVRRMLAVVSSSILEHALACLAEQWIEGLVLGYDQAVVGQGECDNLLHSLQGV